MQPGTDNEYNPQKNDQGILILMTLTLIKILHKIIHGQVSATDWLLTQCELSNSVQ